MVRSAPVHGREAPAQHPSLAQRAKLWLSSPRLAWAAPLLAMALAAPSLGVGLQTEDYLHRKAALEASHPFENLFGDPDADVFAIYHLKDRGFLPWVTAEDWHVAFYRPVASATHWLDAKLWPDSPVAMHAHSLLWLGVLVMVAGALHRRVLGSTAIAGLATLLYAVEDGHGPVTGWLANRNALVAACFGLLAVYFHDRWRRDDFKPGIVLAPACLAVGLLAGELALGATGYLIAHAVVLDDAPARRRALAALPWVAVVIAWAITYNLLGYGASASGAYLDPLTQPLLYLREALVRAPALLFGLYGLFPIDLLALLDPGLLPVLLAGAVLFLALVAWLLSRVLRGSKSVAFWGIGSLVSLLPASTGMPSERLLLLAGVGSMAIVAEFVVRALSGAGKAPRALAVAWLFVHGVLATVLLPVRSLGLSVMSGWVEQAGAQIFADHATEQVVVVNVPDFYAGTLLVAVRHARREPIPKHVRVIYGGHRGVTLERTGPRTLLARADFLEAPSNRVYRGPDQPMRKGEGLQLTGLQMVVREVDERGRPTAVELRFATSLERVAFVAYDGEAYHQIAPPAPGHTLQLPGVSMF